jgi:hypothetical protein
MLPTRDAPILARRTFRVDRASRAGESDVAFRPDSAGKFYEIPRSADSNL